MAQFRNSEIARGKIGSLKNIAWFWGKKSRENLTAFIGIPRGILKNHALEN